jgi:hypothetical protein
MTNSLLQRFTLLLACLGFALLLAPFSLARTAQENRRDFQKLDKGSLERIAKLGEEWKSVDEGHLQRLLIPRAGASLLSYYPMGEILTTYSWIG